MTPFAAIAVLASLILCTPALCREVGAPGELRADGSDWLASDRTLWDIKSRALNGAELKAWYDASPNSFGKAALENTRIGRPFEYTDIRQRHSYYDLMSFILEYSSPTALNSSEVRFFHATTSITAQAEVGMVEAYSASKLESIFPQIAREWGIRAETLEFLRKINQVLFEKNMLVMHDIFYEWQFLKDPRVATPKDRIAALDFDLAMVDLEQNTVQDFINSTSTPNRTLSDVNRMIDHNVIFPRLTTVGATKPWLRNAGYRKDDFSSFSWRVAVGRALVFRFHKLTEADYLAYMRAHPPQLRDRQKLYSGIQAPASTTSESAGYFTIVGSWRTEAGALRHLSELKRENLGIDALVYPPYGRDKYWTVVVSSFASLGTASELTRNARSLRVARDAYVLRRKPIDSVGNSFTPSLAAPGLARDPSFIKAANAEAVTREQGNFLSVFQSNDEQSATARLNHLKADYPDIDFALFRLKDTNRFAVTIAAFASEADLQQSLRLARHLNVPRDQTDIIRVTDPAAVARIDAVAGDLQTVWSVIKNCYSSGKLTVQAMHACSNYWVTPTALSRCVLESDCRVLDDNVLATPAQLETFLRKQGLTLDTELKLDPAGIPVSLDAKKLVSDIQQCRNKAQSDLKIFVRCMTTDIGPSSSREAIACATSYTTASAFAACIGEHSADPNLARVSACISGDYSDPRGAALCMAGADKAKLEGLQQCLGTAKSETEGLTRCAAGVIDDGNQLEKARCIVKAANDPAALINCALGGAPSVAAVRRGFDCVRHSENSATETAACLASIAGGDVGRAAACITESSENEAVVSCMLRDRPELQQARRLYNCAAAGTGTASLIASCSEGILDDNTRQLAGCVADNGSDRQALAGCAAATVLPKELGPVVRCASSSTGGTDFALCMAGPAMNEEWRIAAECAVQSGGNPGGFAGCTAGRLTVRELTKCLSGKIGQDCFGPNNTLFATYKTIGADLQSCLTGKPCLGENNEIVKAAKAMEEGIAHLGHEAENVWNGLFGRNSDWCRGDLTSWTC